MCCVSNIRQRGGGKWLAAPNKTIFTAKDSKTLSKDEFCERVNFLSLRLKAPLLIKGKFVYTIYLKFDK